MDSCDAKALATRYRIPLGGYFHALNSETVERIIEAANLVKYRAPKNANGSRARYFYAYLNRAAARED